MTKLVLVLSFIGLLISFAFGLLDPANPIMWLSSTTSAFAVLRGALMLVIVTLLVTEPPRNTYVRAFVGIVSMTLIGWSITAVYHNHLPVADAFLLLSVGVSTGLTVLERDLKYSTAPSKVESLRSKYNQTLTTN